MKKVIFITLWLGIASYCLGMWPDSQTVDTLHYDGPHAVNLGVDGVNKWWAAVRYLPVKPGTLIAVIFYHGDYWTHSGFIHVWGAGTTNSPGTEYTSEPYTASPGAGWVRVELSTPYNYDAGADIWFGLDVGVNPQNFEHPVSGDAGPAVDERGDWVSVNGTNWEEQQDHGNQLDRNWNIRGIAHAEAGVEEVLCTPKRSKLECSPNPIRNWGRVKYEIPMAALVNIVIYDLTGRLVTVLETEVKAQGCYELKWDASNVSPGIYICKLTAGNLNSIEKIIVLR